MPPTQHRRRTTQLDRIEAMLHAILRGEKYLFLEGIAIMADLTDITAKVTANTSATASVVALLGSLKAQLDAAGTDPVALKALSDQLGANDDALAAAVVANTPAA